MKRAIIFFLVIAIQFTVSAQAANKTARLVAKEESLGKLLPGAEPNTLAVDANFQHVAYVVKRGEKELAVVDSVEGKEYDKVGEKNEMYFSPDGKHLAYVAKRGDKMLVVADGKEGKEYDFIYDSFNPVFSPDSQQLAYIATIQDKVKTKLGLWDLKDFVVVNGVEGKIYELIESIVFSPDSKKIAYSGQPTWNQSSRVIVNGIEGKLYNYTWREIFSPDSQHFAYVADKRNPTRSCAVIDGKEDVEYEGNSPTGDIIFSADSKHNAYRVLRRPQSFVIRDGIPEKNFDVVGTFPVFSPDSKRLAYLAAKGTNWMMIVDGKIFDERNVVQYTHLPVFSPDSQHLVYMTMIDTNWLLVVDGKVEPKSANIFSEPIFTRDNKHLIFLKQHGEKTTVVFGEFESKEYDQFLISNPSLNTRGVLGMTREPFILDKNGTLHAIVLQSNELLRVEFKIVEE
jgi:Tol biopolymer transport system component